MGIAPTILRGRVRRVTLLYEDLDHPDRVTCEIHDPDWSEDDRALLLGLQAYEDTLCPGCGQPKHLAWHDMLADDWMGSGVVCHACTAMEGGTEKPYFFVDLNPDLPQTYLASVTPLELGVNTTEPTPPPSKD